MPRVAQKFIIIVGFGLLVLLAGMDVARPAGFIGDGNPAFAQVRRGVASIPIGHAQFCESHKGECTFNRHAEAVARITDFNWFQLTRINATFNASIVQITDEALYHVEELWTFPDGYGDCEDFVLAKRRALINAGWNPSVLLITIVKQPDGEGHAVLMVRTDRGDLILDNLEGLIKVWSDTPYSFVKRQSQANSGQWVDILDNRPTAIAAR